MGCSCVGSLGRSGLTVPTVHSAGINLGNHDSTHVRTLCPVSHPDSGSLYFYENTNRISNFIKFHLILLDHTRF